jgi:peptide chain release factor 1
MLEKLSFLEERQKQIEKKLSEPEIFSDMDAYKKLMKELKEISPITERYAKLKRAMDSQEEALEILKSESDPEIREMAEEELKISREQREALEEEIKLLLLPKDPNDDKNVIVEIRGGAGGEEAALFAYNLYRMYSMYAETKGWKSEILNLNETEHGRI